MPAACGPWACTKGATVSVINKRHCLLVDVRGTRLALGTDLAQGITVQPHERAAS
jgi:Fe2+ transport system protein FeoA